MATGQTPNVDATVLGALDTVAKQVFRNGFHINKKDKKKFLRLLRRVSIEKRSECIVPTSNEEVNNGVSHDFQPPGQ